MASNDFCTREGAMRLKERIEAYWKDRGYDVNIELHEAGFMPAMRSARTDVRSNMVNGSLALPMIALQSVALHNLEFLSFFDQLCRKAG